MKIVLTTLLSAFLSFSMAYIVYNMGYIDGYLTATMKVIK